MIDWGQFGRLTHYVITRLQKKLANIETEPLTPTCIPEAIVTRLRDAPVPVGSSDVKAVVEDALRLILDYSLFTAHPRFLGYVCPAADPIGVIADTIVATVNPNAASAVMAPIGHEIEQAVIRWLAQILRLPNDSDGVLLSGGNESNLVGILAAREHQAPWPIRTAGFNHPDAAPLCVYATAEVHNGIHKAVEIAGLGTSALRMIRVDKWRRMDVKALREAIHTDRKSGAIPICIVATVGTVATGAIDPLSSIVDLAASEGVWVHVDGCYGAAAALLTQTTEDIRAMSGADSVSWDPHKWLRVPMEAACLLARRPNCLSRVFAVNPSYYYSGRSGQVVNYYEKSPQNSRQLRALKVWMSLNLHGISGHAALIARDIELAKTLFQKLQASSAFEAWTIGLSIVTFRYVPAALLRALPSESHQPLLNEVNRRILDRIQESGDAFLSNAVVDGSFLLRACFVNYNTQPADVEHLMALLERCAIDVENTLR